MTTYGVTPDGFAVKTLGVIKEEIYDEQLANIDAGLTPDEQSVVQNNNTALSNQIAQLWELGQGIYNSQYPDSANDFSLDQVAAITGTKRSDYSKTTVSGQVTLNPFKSLPAGSVAHLVSQPDKRFVTLTEVPADDNGGTFDVVFEAEENGAIQVTSNQLTQIAEPISGWTAVDNTDPGTTGMVPESNPDFRIKRESELQAQGSTNIDSIRADVLSTSGVVDAKVIENVTDTADAQGLLPHSIYVVVRGGAVQDVAQAIFDSKAAGINTKGLESAEILDSEGEAQTIRFDFATELVTYVDMVLNVGSLAWGGAAALTEIQTRILAYINGLRISSDVNYDRIKCTGLSQLGVISIDSLEIGFVFPPIETSDLTVGTIEFASAVEANVVVATV